MVLLIAIEMDNAAFEGDSEQEVRRILDSAFERLDVSKPRVEEINLSDVNGNWVGLMRVSDEPLDADRIRGRNAANEGAIKQQMPPR